MGQGGELCVRGEAQSDELGEGEGVDESELAVGQEVGEPQLLFEPDEAVLRAQCGHAADAGHGEEDNGHGDPPEVGVLVTRPGVDGCIDGEAQVEQQHGNDEEVEERVEARVVFVGLWLSHVDDDSAVGLR